METDALSRRKRTEVIPRGKHPVINQGVLDLLEGLRRYHPLPPRIAFEFWSGGSSYQKFQDKLTDLTHEGEPLLVRPEHFNPKGVLNSEPVWYELSEHGRRIALSGATSPLQIAERDHLKHRAMNACVGASFEILAPDHGLRPIHLEEIIAHPKCPTETRKAANPLRIPLGRDRYIEPDFLRGDEGEGGFSFYAGEIDRATESNVRTVFDKLDRWLEVFDRRTYEEWFGLPNLRVMFITTAPGRVKTLLDYLEGKPKAERFLFKAFPDFGVSWRAPRAPLSELFEPWQTVAGPKDITA